MNNETNNEMINKLVRKLIQVDINKRLKWKKYFNINFFKINNLINNNQNEQIIEIKFKIIQIIMKKIKIFINKDKNEIILK